MSVINQVLRDLDKRQQSAQRARVRSHYQSTNSRPWVWVGALSTTIVLSALVTWWLVSHAFSATENTGTSAMQAPRITAPQLSTEPQSAQANSKQASLESVQGLATDDSAQVSEPHDESVTAMLTDQQSATNNSAAEVNVAAQLESSNKQAVNQGTATEQSSASTDGEGATNTSRPTNSAAQPTQDTKQVQVEESRGEMRVERVERSATELAAQRLEQAIGAMEGGQGRKAETLLQEALVLAPQFVEARQQLAAYYYGRGFSSEALRVLREGLVHTPADVRLLTLSARIYEDSGRADEALTMLNRVDADVPQQNDIVVLRAALANELGQYQIAADDYRQLLAVNPNQGIWWLGLGVAEEGRGQYDAARLAYQRAGEDSGLDRASREYARSRVEALATW